MCGRSISRLMCLFVPVSVCFSSVSVSGTELSVVAGVEVCVDGRAWKVKKGADVGIGGSFSVP